MNKLIPTEKVFDLNIKEIQEHYKNFVNPGQLKQISKFSFGKDIPTKAEGINIHLENNKVIKDFTGGIGVLNHGHNHPRILKVRRDYIDSERIEVHKNFFSPFIAALSNNLSFLFSNVLQYSYFCNSGAESVEGAVKLCYKYFNGKRKTILATDISFHGKLYMSGGISNSPEVKFKWPFPGEKETFVYNDIESFKQVFETQKNDLYAVIIEPFNASSLQYFSNENLVEIRRLTKKEGIPLIFDEVYTGWYKTLNMFNFMRVKDLFPDIVTTSKSFGGGKSSIAAYVTQKWLFKGAYGKTKDSIIHSTTYNGFGEETITAIESINICQEDNYSARVLKIHNTISNELIVLKSKHSNVIKSVSGEGALWGIFFKEEAINVIARNLIKNIKVGVLDDSRFLSKLLVSSIIEEMYANHNYLLFFGSNQKIQLVISTPINIDLNEFHSFFYALDKTLSLGLNNLIIKFIKKNILG